MFRSLGGILVACLLGAACGTPGGLVHTAIPPLAGQRGSFDQATIDQAAEKLYLADGTLGAVDVFDVSQSPPRFITSVRLGHAPHGMALAPDLHKLFVGLDGGGVAVLEADPGARGVNTVLATIATSAKKNVDLVDYQPGAHVLWAASSDDGILTRIDAIRNLATGHMNLVAGLEQPRFNPADHLLYLPNQARNLLYQINPDKLEVAREWSLGVRCSPTGLGIDPRRQVAMLGCVDPGIAYTLEWNLATGRMIRTFTQVANADQVVYDPASDLYLVAGSSNGTTAVGFFGGSPAAYRSSKLTHADTKAVAMDDRTKVVYTPGAHPGEVGLISFALPPADVAAPPYLAPLLYLLPLVVVGFVVWYFGRKRERERRLAGRPQFS